MLRINDKYYIESDGVQFTLRHVVERTKKEDGTKYDDVETLGYYARLEDSINGYIKHRTLQQVRDVDMDTAGIKRFVDSLKAEVYEMFTYQNKE